MILLILMAFVEFVSAGVSFLPTYSLTWSTDRPTGGDITFVITGDGGSDTWYGLGFTDNTAAPYMLGADMVVCSQGGCGNYRGTSYGAPTKVADYIYGVNISLHRGVGIFVASFVRPMIRPPPPGYYTVDQGVMTGVIYASGPWAPGPSISAHAVPSGCGHQRIDFSTGQTAGGRVTTTSHYYLVALGLLMVYLAVLAVGALFLRGGLANNTPLTQSAVCLGFLAVLCVWVYLNSVDYRNAGASVPGYRGVGMGVVLCLTVQIVPALRRATPFAFERSVLYHGVLGTALLGVMTVHLVGMWTTYGIDFILRTPQYTYGLACYVVVLLLVVTATLARRLSYEAHQCTHFPLVVASYVLAVMHYPPLLKWAAASIGLFAVDAGCRLNNLHKCPIVRIERKKSFTAVTFDVPFTYTGGQYGLFTFPTAVVRPWLQSHPFSLVPVVGAPAQAMALINKMGKGSYTAAISAGLSPTVGDNVWVSAPYGRLTHPIDWARTLYLVCGGVGVTPMLSLLMHYGPTMRTDQRVVFVWSVREMDLLTYVMPLLASAVTRAACPVQTVVHFTGLVDVVDDVCNVLPPGVMTGRPPYHMILAARENESGETALVSPGSSTADCSGRRVAHICGPRTMGDAVTALCRKRSIDFHREVFEF